MLSDARSGGPHNRVDDEGSKQQTVTWSSASAFSQSKAAYQHAPSAGRAITLLVIACCCWLTLLADLLNCGAPFWLVQWL